MIRAFLLVCLVGLSGFSFGQIDNPEAEAILITKMGDEYLKVSEYDHAIYYYQKALRIYPGYVKTQFQLAQCFRLSMEFDSAFYHYKAIIEEEQDRRYPMSRYHLAMIQKDRNQPADARENLIRFKDLLMENRLHELKKYKDFYQQAQNEIEKL